MTKRIIVLMTVLMLILSGCNRSQNHTEDLVSSLDKAVDKAIAQEIPDTTYNNCQKTYYSYYKSVAVGKAESDAISNCFTIEGNDSALTLDIASIAASTIMSNTDSGNVRDIGTLDDVFYTRKGVFNNNSGDSIPYQISVAVYEDDKYFVLIQTSEFIFISDIKNGSVESTIYDMIVLLRSCNVNTTQVLVDYSNDTIIDRPVNIITLFKEVLPETGYVIDYMEDWRQDTTFIIIDNTDTGDPNSAPMDSVTDDEELIIDEELEGLDDYEGME